VSDTLALLAEIFTIPLSDMCASMGRTVRGEAMFSEASDEGDPPGLADAAAKEGPLDFELVLGFYEADVRRITCFPKGISYVATTLKVHPDLVERIVRYHEHAHAIHHLGISNAKSTREDAAALQSHNHVAYRLAPDETKEQIAQIATLATILTGRKNASPEAQAIFDRMLDIFFMLMKRQSLRYQLPPAMRNADPVDLREAISLLLDMSDDKVFPSADHIGRIIANWF
jgi:hypothetical protein